MSTIDELRKKVWSADGDLLDRAAFDGLVQ